MGRGDIASLDVSNLWKILSLIFIFPNDMPADREDHHTCVTDREEHHTCVTDRKDLQTCVTNRRTFR